MATQYPGTIDSFTNPTGTTTQDGPTAAGHAGQHTDLNGAVTALENALGTTAGTFVLKSFVAGEFAVRNTGGGATGTLTQTLVNGTINNATLGTPIMNAFNSSGTGVPTTSIAALAPTVGTLADSSGGTITANSAAGQIFQITLGTNATNRTIGTPNNPADGQALLYRVKQNAAAVGTLIWASVFRFSSDAGTPTLGTASTWNYYGWRYNSSDVKWDFAGQSKNII